jgi:hypothetical protein
MMEITVAAMLRATVPSEWRLTLSAAAYDDVPAGSAAKYEVGQE